MVLFDLCLSEFGYRCKFKRFMADDDDVYHGNHTLNVVQALTKARQRATLRVFITFTQTTRVEILGINIKYKI